MSKQSENDTHQHERMFILFDQDFSSLFTTLGAQLDLSAVMASEVPADFFPELKEPDLGEDIIILEEELPLVDVPTPQEQKFVYFLVNEWANLAGDAKPAIEQQREKARQIITQIRQENLKIAVRNKKHGFNLIKNVSIFKIYMNLGLSELMPSAMRIEAQTCLDLLTALEQKIDKELDTQFTDSKLARPSATFILEQLVSKHFAATPAEVLEIVKNGPQVRGFSKAIHQQGDESAEVSDEDVKLFLRKNFPIALHNSQLQIARVTGTDEILYKEVSAWEPEVITETEYAAKIAESGPETVSENTFLSQIVGTDWISIPLFNMCQNIPEMAVRMLASLDYLESSWSDKKKRTVYALGILAHEFVHRLQTVDVMAAYKSIAITTWNQPESRWRGYPTEYVMFYKTKYDKDEDHILDEDLADAVQIYVINSRYLLDNFPERYQFIQQTFPHIIPDSAAEACS